jgi:hypothetical protein
MDGFIVVLHVMFLLNLWSKIGQNIMNGQIPWFCNDSDHSTPDFSCLLHTCSEQWRLAVVGSIVQ